MSNSKASGNHAASPIDHNLRIASSSETTFDMLATFSLKPLLRFITAEFFTSMQQSSGGPISNFPVVDFVVQVLLANKDNLEAACRCANVNALSSALPVPSLLSAAPGTRDVVKGAINSAEHNPATTDTMIKVGTYLAPKQPASTSTANLDYR